jgi:hypothetical protein
LAIISIDVQVLFVFNARRELLFVTVVLLRIGNAFIGQCKIDLIAFLLLLSFIVGRPRLGRYVSYLWLPAGGVQRFHHDIQGKPDVSVITLFEGVEFAVIGATIRIDLGLFVPIQYTSHGPLTVNETGIANLQVYVTLTARTSD